MDSTIKAVVVFLISLFTFVAAADDYRDSSRHFVLTAPSGWNRVSEKNITAVNDFASKVTPQAKQRYLAGFSKHSKDLLAPPYVLVIDLGTNFNGMDYDTIAQSIGALDLSKISKKSAEKLGEHVKDLSMANWVLDRARNRMTMKVSVTDAGGQKLTCDCIMFMSNKTIIQLNCYSQEGKEAESRSEFDMFVEGFQLDQDAEFHPGPSEKAVNRAGAIGQVFGIVLGLVIGIIVYRKFKHAPLHA